MTWQAVGNEVAKHAPVLGLLLSASTGEQNAAVRLVVSALSLTGAVTPEAVSAELQKPEAIQKLKQFESDHLFQLAQIQPPCPGPTRSVMDDLNAKNGRIAFWSAAVVSVVVSVGFFVAFGIIANETDTSKNQDLHLLVGALIAGFTQVISYYLGSSSSSMAKTQLLANSVPKE